MGLASCARTQSLDADVIVVGAGLAGLYAARLLAAEGKDVVVLEAADRVGGRTHSLDIDGHVSEAGGEQIGSSYARVRDVATQEGLEIIPDGAGLPTRLHVAGEVIAPEDWPDHPLNPMPADFRRATPSSALFIAASQDNPLDDPLAWSGLEDVSAEAFLTAKGFSPEAQRLIDHTLNATDLASYGMANVFRSLALYRLDREGGLSGHLAGGMQRLAEAMAAKHDVRTGEPVVSIRETADSVQVETGTKVWRAPHAVSTLPLPVYKTVQTDTAFDIRALSNALPYTPIRQVHFMAEPRAHHIWSDGPMERVFAHRDADGAPTGLHRAWINGTGALQREDDRAELAALVGSDVDIRATVDWTPANPLAGGAYRHFAPGQSMRFGKAFADAPGRVRFAGEHAGVVHTGLESAMESGERAAFHILGV